MPTKKSPKMNPYLPDDFVDRLSHSLPESHPANEVESLTPLQKFALPVLLWFFDYDRYLGQGRTELMAEILIQMAMRGKAVKVHDWSRALAINVNLRETEHMINVIFDRIKKYYPKHIFEFRKMEYTLIYKGKRP